MKQILIYLNPNEDFGGENKNLIKLQIDNSLDLGWTYKDIILVTNFHYEYKGIKAYVDNQDDFCDYIVQNTKTNVIVTLFKKGVIKKDILYWLHDLDCYQNEPFEEPDLEGADMGLTNYGRMPRLNMGSIFFRYSASDIFKGVKKIANKDKILDELALTLFMSMMENPDKRIKTLNISYNFQPFNLPRCYQMAIKPLKALHFHPDITIRQMGINTLDWFLRGKNKINTVLMSDRLIKIFNNYGYK